MLCAWSQGEVGTVSFTCGVRYNNTVHNSIGKAPFEIVEGGRKFLRSCTQRIRFLRLTGMLKIGNVHGQRWIMLFKELRKSIRRHHINIADLWSLLWVIGCCKVWKGKVEKDEGPRASFSQVKHAILWTFSDIGKDERGVLSTQASSQLENTMLFK